MDVFALGQIEAEKAHTIRAVWNGDARHSRNHVVEAPKSQAGRLSQQFRLIRIRDARLDFVDERFRDSESGPHFRGVRDPSIE